MVRILNHLRASFISFLFCFSLKVVNRDKDEDETNEVVTPTYLYDALRSHGFVFTNGFEQDAHELFQGLLDALSETEKDVEPDPLLLSEETTEESNPSVLRKLGSNAVSSPTEEQLPFIGTMTCRVENSEAVSKSPTRSIFFNNVTLYLPTQTLPFQHPISLEYLLQTNLIERLETSASKLQSFARLPKCLCLHIQRTGFSSGFAFKRDDKVQFPLYLNMTNFVYSQQLCRRKTAKLVRSATVDLDYPSEPSLHSQNSYGLCAVIVHIGEISTGHYITYRKCQSGGKVKWYFTSDGDIKQVSLEQVLASNPYIIVYEKMKAATPSNSPTLTDTTSPPQTPLKLQ